jgi:hypothetical protein
MAARQDVRCLSGPTQGPGSTGIGKQLPRGPGSTIGNDWNLNLLSPLRP